MEKEEKGNLLNFTIGIMFTAIIVTLLVGGMAIARANINSGNNETTTIPDPSTTVEDQAVAATEKPEVKILNISGAKISQAEQSLATYLANGWEIKTAFGNSSGGYVILVKP